MPFSFIFALALLFQATPANPPADALTFLKNVAQGYVNAKTYHIEVTIEETTSNDFSRDWQKFLLTAIVAPGGRYRYEGRSGMGSAMIVSDGTHKWDYHVEEHQYTETRVSTEKAGTPPVISPQEYPVVQARNVMPQIQALVARLKSATFLPDETVAQDGRSIECRVVHFTDADFKTHNRDLHSDETIWVDKARNVIVKTATLSSTFSMMAGSSAHIPIKMEQTTTYSTVELDSPQPASVFTFAPPADAKLIASFPNPLSVGFGSNSADFVGKPAPDVHLKRNGQDIQLSSYRGKPVFVEFWATWCEPCVALIPELKELYAQTHDKGLVWAGVDKGDDAGTMDAYVTQEHIPWPNYNDEDGSISKAFQCQAIPLGVLIDPAGKVTLYGGGYSLPELRAAIAKLGPHFADVATGAANKPAAAAQP